MPISHIADRSKVVGVSLYTLCILNTLNVHGGPKVTPHYLIVQYSHVQKAPIHLYDFRSDRKISK